MKLSEAIKQLSEIWSETGGDPEIIIHVGAGGLLPTRRINLVDGRVFIDATETTVRVPAKPEEPNEQG